MKNTRLRRRAASVLAAAVMSVSAVSGAVGSTPYILNGGISTVFAAESAVKFYESVGYAEGLYATWAPVSGADGYNVYVDNKQIDSMLIRQYKGYFRADAVGLSAGSHTMKVVPVISKSEDTSKAASTSVTVYAHDRSGFGFVNGSSSGAYNDNGTLKSGATVVYVTNANKNSVSVTMPDKKGNNTTVTGIQNIINNAKSNTKCGPLDIRFIGNITDPSTLTSGDLYVDTVTCGITIEGIGSDATLNGFGLSIKKSSNVEVRNLGFMNCNSSEGDDCSLPAGNDHCWVHNCDFFYGDAGSDADQAKGDGALDTKTSSYVTHSYNHFWDNGKCNLQGMKSESTENYITYHHNWYDHSDSRHPRIRTCSVHCYNNYFDGNAKYGVGVTMGSSCFVENNYYRNCKYPMLSSNQGSDIATGGTFSGETGGIIKAYGNYMEGQKAFITYQQSSSDFDAYAASSRTEKVPSSVKTKSGGTTYNNFDTSSIMYSYTADAAADVPSIVMAKAGRVGGGDFQWQFNNSVDDESYAVNQQLKSALTSYKDSITAIGSGFVSDSSTYTPPTVTTAYTPGTVITTTNGGGSQTVVTTASGGSSTTVTSGTYEHDFTANGTSSSFYSITGNLSSAKGTVSYYGKTLTQCLKIETSTSISFTAGGSGKLTLVFGEANATIKVNGTKYTADSNGILTVDVSSGTNTIAKADSVNLFYMSYTGAAGSSSSTDQPTVTTTQGGGSSTPASTTVSYTDPTDIYTGDIKCVSAGGWNEMAWLVLSGIKDSDVKSVSYNGPVSGTLTGDDFTYLVRDTSQGLRVDLTGLKAGTYSISVDTGKETVTKTGIKVTEQDRSGYAHFNNTEGVGAYNDDGTLKANAKVLYITDSNKDTVSITSKDGTKVTGIGNILNSAGQDIGGGKTSNGGTKTNSNSGIIKKLAEDGTPLVIRIVGNVSAPSGLTVYDSTDVGGSVGDNGYMARMKSGKDITIEGIGTDACINGWGIHFMCESAAPTFGKNFEVRNIAFKNVPEDCIGMEGVQDGSTLTAPVERCWIHNNEFYVPSISNPAESDKAQGDGACDFKRGQYFTNSYNYYEGYHKTNLVGASDSNLQFNITFHHNYWNKCESRGPLARQANIHMYNNIFEGQTSYCQNPRANAYIFSEYNLFSNSKNPGTLKSGGVIKSFNDTFSNCKGDMQATTVTSKSTKVSNSCQISDFDTNSAKSYIPSGDYVLSTNTSSLKSAFEKDGGCLGEMSLTDSSLVKGGSTAVTTTTVPATTTTTTTTVTTTTTTETTPATTTTDNTPSDFIIGDANDDNGLSVADAVYILQYLSDGNSFPMSDNGRNKGDVNQKGDGITALDALAIQKYLAGVLPALPES